MVTVGRILFARIERWFLAHRTYQVLPFGLAVMFVAIVVLPEGTPAPGVVAFALAGFGCSDPMSDLGSSMGAVMLGQAASDAMIVSLRRPLNWANAAIWPV